MFLKGGAGEVKQDIPATRQKRDGSTKSRTWLFDPGCQSFGMFS